MEVTGPLSFATLEKAYFSITYGYNGPDLIRCSHRNLVRLGCGKFNGALVQEDPDLSDDVIVVSYTDPKDVKALATDAGAKKGEYDKYTVCTIHIQETL